jgi:hypothetical protein
MGVPGSWLNLTESIQRIINSRALNGTSPAGPQDIITWLEATARGWNAYPTPFVWAGKRKLRRQCQERNEMFRNHRNQMSPEERYKSHS